MTTIDNLLQEPIVHANIEEAKAHSMDKDWYSCHVISDPFVIQYASNALRNDKELMEKTIVRGNGLTLAYASDELKNDSDLVRKAIKSNPLSLAYASFPLRHNIDLICEAIQGEPGIYVGLEENFKRNRKITITFFENDKNYERKEAEFKKLTPKLKNNIDVLISSISIPTTDYLIKNFCEQVSIKQLAWGVNKNFELLDWISPHIKNDPRFYKELHIHIACFELELGEQHAIYALEYSVLNDHHEFERLLKQMMRAYRVNFHVNYIDRLGNEEYLKRAIFIYPDYASLELVRKYINLHQR